MQVSITGATGLIGKRLVRYYEELGATVHVLSRGRLSGMGKNTRCFQQDLSSCSADDLADFVAESDIVYHCAAELHDTSKMYELNVLGTKKLFQAASKANIRRWVQLSSVGVYGRPRKGVVDEAYATAPQNPYEKSKLEADEWLLAQAQQGLLELVLLRPSTVFADDMSNQSLSQFIRAVQRGRFFYIGSKQAQLNYVHADDVMAALILCGHHANAKGRTFILSEHISVEEFIEVVAGQLHCTHFFFILPEWGVRGLAKLFSWVPGFPLTTSRIDALTSRCIFLEEQITQHLGYAPTVSLRDGFMQFASNFMGRK